MKTILAFSTLLFSLAAGCASASTPAPSDQGGAADLTGTWGFVLASSDVAAPLRERCATHSQNDATKSKACWDEVAREAAREKVRFGRDGSGHVVWTSFETDGKKESIYVEVPVELSTDGPGHVLAKVSGAPKGEHAAQFAKASVNVIRIEVVDATTIAMNDPKKGRLVYTKE